VEPNGSHNPVLLRRMLGAPGPATGAPAASITAQVALGDMPIEAPSCAWRGGGVIGGERA